MFQINYILQCHENADPTQISDVWMETQIRDVV